MKYNRFYNINAILDYLQPEDNKLGFFEAETCKRDKLIDDITIKKLVEKNQILLVDKIIAKCNFSNYATSIFNYMLRSAKRQKFSNISL